MKKSRLIALISLIAACVISLTLSACLDVDANPPIISTDSSVKTDFVAPTITVDGASEYIVKPGTIFRLPQITAQDDRDAELISDITVKHGEEEVALTDYAFVAEKSGVYTVTVNVSDMSENVATKEILVHVYGENEINGFDNEVRLNNVTGKGITNLSINTDPAYIRYGEGSLKLEVLQHTNVTWPGIIVSDLPISDISEYYSISFWAYNDGAEDLTIYLQRNEVNAKAKYILAAHAWTKIEVKSRDFDNVFQPMAKSGAEPEVGNCEDLKSFTFHFENKANVPTFNIYVDQIVVNEAAVLDEIEIKADFNHPIVGQEFTLPVPTVSYGGEVVEAGISYVLYDSKYNEIALDGNTHVFTLAGKYVLSISAEYAGFVGTKNFTLVCADSRAENEIEFFESNTALNFFKSPHLKLSITTDQHHSANNSTASLKIHSSSSVWPYINMTDLPYSNLEGVAYIYFYAKTDYALKDGQIAYIGIRDGAQGKVLKRLALSNDWECYGFTKVQLAEMGVTTLQGLQLCVEFYDKSNPANQGGWCPIAFDTYVDNFTVAFVEEPTEKAENVVLDFANYRDIDNINSSYVSYNFQKLEYTLNNKGSLQVYCAGKWPTMTLNSTFEKFSLEGVKNVVIDVFVPSVASGHYVRVGANDTHYQKVYSEDAGKWVSLYIPVEAFLSKGNTLANQTINFARHNGSDWIDLGTLYIGQIRLDYEGKPVEKHEFTGAETADDVYMFTVQNSDYNISLNTDPAFVKEGNASIKLNAVPRWPQYFFSQEFIDWLKAEGVESISFDLYIDNAGSNVNVVMMEGLGATSSPKLDQWFTLSIAVDKLTTATRLQFNKDASGALNVYLDNMKFYNPSKDFSNGETERDLAMFSVQNDLYTVTLNTDAKFVKEGSASIKLSAVPCWPQYFFTQEYIDWLKENGYTYISFELYVDDTTKNLITMEGAYYAPFAMRNEWFTIVLKVADLTTSSRLQFNKNRAENMDAYLDNVKFYTALPTEFSGDAETLKDLEMFRVESAGSVVSLNTNAQFVKEGSASIKLSAEARWPQFFLSQAYVDWLVAGGYESISFDMYIDAAGSATTVSAMEGAITKFELDKWFTVTLNVADLSSATKIQFNKDAVAPLNVYVDNIKLEVANSDFTGAETERDLAMFSVQNNDYKVTLNSDAAFVKEGNASIKLSAVPRWPQYYFTQEFIDWLNSKGYTYISFELYVDDATNNLITMEGAYYAPFAMRNEWFTVVLKVADLTTSSRLQFNKNRAESMDAYLDNVKFYTALPTEFSGDAETLKDLEMFRVESAGSVVSLNTNAQFVKNGSASIKLSAEARWPQFFLSQAYVDWLVAGGYESISFDMYIDAAGSETTVSAMEGAITKFELDKWFTVTLNVADLSSATKIQFNKDAVAPLNVYVDNIKLKLPMPDYTGAESEYDLTMFRVQYGEALTLSTDFVKAGSYSIKMTATPRWPAYYFTQEYIDWLNANEVDYISFFLYIDQAGSATKVYAMEGAVTSYVVDKWFNVTLKVSSLTTSTMLQFDKNEAASLSVYLDDITYIKGEELASENEYSDIAIFRVTNTDYKIGDNFDSTYVTAGKYSIKFTADPRWPQYFFTQEYIDWLKANNVEKISFKLYIDAANSETTVTAMEGLVTKFELDKWFSVTLEVSKLTTSSRLQVNKPAAKSLSFYLDDMQFTKHVHSYQSEVTEPTCTAAGFTTHTCSCGDSYTDTPVDALGHTEGAAATCTTAQTCTVCGVQLAPALGHDLVDHVCSVCGLTICDGIILDGEIDAAYGSVATVAEYSEDRSITLRGAKTANGVVLHAVAVMNNCNTNQTGDWSSVANFEFRLNAGAQRYVNVNGASYGVTKYSWTTTTNADGKYVITVELFVDKELIQTWGREEIQVNYAWKSPGETGYVRGNYVNFWAYRDKWIGDWFASHLGGLDVGANDFTVGLDNYGIWADNLRLTEDGLKIGYDASEAVIDGNLEEYAGLASHAGDHQDDSSLTLTGKAGSDGLYLAITITHASRSAFNANDWWNNDNLEFNINEMYNQQNVILIKEGKLIHSAYWDKAAMVTTGEEGNYTTTIELYAAGVAKVYKVFVGINGTGFNGWQPLGRDVYITPNGVALEAPAYLAQANLDGILDDAIWTEEVLAKAHTTTANGATVTMVGVSSDYGVHMAFTVKHSKALDAACQGDGTAWWNFMGPEVRLGGIHYNQIAFTAWNNTAINCSMGYTSSTNEDGTYTTVYEIFVPYHVFQGSGHRVAVVVGGVFETGFTRLWGAYDWASRTFDQTTHYITPNGIIVAEQ